MPYPVAAARGKSNPSAAVVADWWLADGLDPSACFGAWMGLGAASYAASQTNLANPGTNNLATNTTAPLWSAANGWQGDGTGRGMLSALTMAFDTNSTVFARVKTITATGGYIWTCPTVARVVLAGSASDTVSFNAGANVAMTWADDHVTCLAGNTGYIDGVSKGTFTRSTVTGVLSLLSNTARGSPLTGYLLAVAAYTAALSGPQVAQISAAMAAATTGAQRVGGLAVYFGDSVTAGTGASDAAHRWANLVHAASGYATLVNSGLSGTVLQNTTQNAVATIGGAAANNGRDTYGTRVSNYLPEYVFILYGLNDLRLNDAAFTAANFENDLGEVVDGLIASGMQAANIVLGSPPYIPEASYTNGAYAPYNAGSRVKHAAYTAACAAVASAKGTKYADVYQHMTDNGGDTLISGDGIHPNDAGHDAIADAFLAVL